MQDTMYFVHSQKVDRNYVYAKLTSVRYKLGVCEYTVGTLGRTQYDAMLDNSFC